LPFDGVIIIDIPVDNGRMKMKRIIFSLLLLLLLFPLGAAAKSDAPYQEVTGTNNWKYTMDISEMEEGTYNFIIRATDSAGNESLVGPYNFRVDPNSDLPVAAFSYPSAGSRAGGVLNVVGTAYDDDAVGLVEIKIDEGPWNRAQGRDFWSYLLNTQDIPDGEHMLTIRPQDINGIYGEEVSVNFILDKFAPANNLISHSSGVLLSGRNTIEGIITDANGISSLELSQDGGESYEELRLSFDKKTDEYAFSFNFDSRDIDDGSYIYWLKSQDTTGSIAILPFQFYVDNQGPELNLISPVVDQFYRGLVPMAGSVLDQIGVKSLHYYTSENKDPIEIPLTPGNPYWAYDGDFSQVRGDRIDITFVLEDLTGNISDYKERVELDKEGDRPVLQWFYENGEVFHGGKVELLGALLDDDPAGILRFSLDRSEITELSVDRVFRLQLTDIAPGDHKLEVTPVDSFGIEGETVELEFRMAQAAPQLEFQSLLKGDEMFSWNPGMELDPQVNSTITGFINSVEKPTLYMISEQPDIGVSEEGTLSLKAATEGEGWTFSIPVKKGSLPGLYKYNLRALDSYGQEDYLSTAFYVQEIILADDGKTVQGLRNNQPDGLFLTEQNPDDQGFIHVSENHSISGWVKGGSISSLELDKEATFLRLTPNGSSFTIESRGEGYISGVTITVKLTGGNEYTIRNLNIKTDLQGPRLTDWQDNPWESGQQWWKSEELNIQGLFEDSNGVKQAFYSLDGETFRPMERGDSNVSQSDETEGVSSDSVGNFSFNQTIGLNSLETGFFILTLKAVDTAGNEQLLYYPYFKDNQVEDILQLTPAEEDIVIRETTLVFRIPESEDILRAEFSTDGETWIPVELQNDILIKGINLQDYETIIPENTNQESDAAPEADGTAIEPTPTIASSDLVFRLTDRSGNQKEVSPSFIIDREADKPVLVVQTPLQDGTIIDDFEVSGYVLDNDSIDALLYRVDGQGDFQESPGGNTYNIEIVAASLIEGNHYIEVQARDLGGNLSEIIQRDFKVSHLEPESLVTYPLVEDVVKEVVEITGESSDLNGISKVYISLNNGRNFNLMEGTEQWSYRFDSRLLDDGAYSFLIKALDGAGVEGIYVSLVNIDNSPPLLELDFPAEGSSFTDNVRVEGRLRDDNITSLNLMVEQNGTVLEERVMELAQVIKTELDTSAYEPGTYTVRLEALDSAGNSSFVSRIIQKATEVDTRELTISFPRKGSEQGPDFLLEGQLTGLENPGAVAIYRDGAMIGSADVSSSGWFEYPEDALVLSQGEHIYEAVYLGGSEEELRSEEWPLTLMNTGGWITMDSIHSGEFVRDRPWISGSIGYENVPLVLSGEDDKDDQRLEKEWTKLTEEMLDAEIWISMDNGISFVKAILKKDQWKYRLETEPLQDGAITFLVEARFPDGSKRIVESLLQFDKQLPDLGLLNQEVIDGNFNGSFELNGTAFDENGLSDVSVIMREGDKRSYSTPSFIQGLYLDFHFLGATYFDVGLGLTFFEDNVKLQAQLGRAPDSIEDTGSDLFLPTRFSGFVIGGKLLANLGTIPFGYFLGPDWDLLEASFAVGANFSYFTMSDGITFNSQGKLLSCVIAQLEFPKVSLFQSEYIRYISFYTEGQVWFVPSDVAGAPSILPQIGIGTRIGFF
jgi:hypothetical protein